MSYQNPEINYLEREIEKLTAKKQQLEKGLVINSQTALEELKNCKFKVRQTVSVEPSERFKTIFPEHISSQEAYKVWLNKAFYIEIYDYDIITRSIINNIPENIKAVLIFLKENGVSKDKISYYNESHGSVSSCEYYLARAIEERDNLLSVIDEVFKE